MELDNKMKNCLQLAMEDDNLDFAETVEQAIMLYHEVTGEPLQVEDEEEFHEFFHLCTTFILDTVIANLILKGVVEVSSLDENGEWMYGLTEEGRKVAEERLGIDE